MLLEWKGPEIDGRVDGHLGLGFATALTAADRSAVTGGDPSPTSPLPPEFSTLVVPGRAGRLATQSGELELRRGRTALVLYSAGQGELERELAGFAACHWSQAPDA